MAPPTQPQTVPQLFTEIQKSIQKQDYKNVVRCANLILHTKEGNHDLDQSCKMAYFLWKFRKIEIKEKTI